MLPDVCMILLRFSKFYIHVCLWQSIKSEKIEVKYFWNESEVT